MKPSALYHLHDFYQPQPPSWMPHTVGWYFVFALVVVFAAWPAWRAWAHWRRNRYRRVAIRELKTIEASAIPSLLKRTALAAWPREQVASLSAEQWLRFLEKHAPGKELSKEAGRLLVEVDYREARLTAEQEIALRKAAGDWIRGHRARA
jgi:hypothetical protein